MKFLVVSGYLEFLIVPSDNDLILNSLEIMQVTWRLREGISENIQAGSKSLT